MKRMILKLADLIGVVWQLLPDRWRLGALTGLLVVESRGQDAGRGLRRLLLVRDRLDWILNERAMAYGGGEHPKHRLMPYHDFFIDRIADGERVLDVGCGYGAVARDIALAHPGCRVVGIDQDAGRLAQARAAANPANLEFVAGDATLAVPDGRWDVVVLSNVLEHIDDRVAFLRALRSTTGAGRILLRVPLFERDWQMALRRELGMDFRSDADHRIEHTLAEFDGEIHNAGLCAIERMTLWGEIWAECRAADAADRG
jgi:SAM-dependent methyltransferase